MESQFFLRVQLIQSAIPLRLPCKSAEEHDPVWTPSRAQAQPQLKYLDIAPELSDPLGRRYHAGGQGSSAPHQSDRLRRDQRGDLGHPNDCAEEKDPRPFTHVLNPLELNKRYARWWG